MEPAKINGFNAILITLLLLTILIANISAETTFFDQNDAFIMGNSNFTTTGEVIEETTNWTTGEGGCLTNWTCSSWSSCVNGIQIRNCTKEKAYCYADLKIKPVENQSCSIENENERGIDNLNSFNVKRIILGILIIIVISFIIFFEYNKHKKRRYHHRY